MEPQMPQMETPAPGQRRQARVFRPDELPTAEHFQHPDLKRRLTPEEGAVARAHLEAQGLLLEVPGAKQTRQRAKPEQKPPTAQEIARSLIDQIRIEIQTLDVRAASIKRELENPFQRTSIQGVPQSNDESYKVALASIAEERAVNRIKYEWLEHTVAASPQELRQALNTQQEAMATSYREAISRGVQEHGSPDAAHAHTQRIAPQRRAMKAYDELDKTLQKQGV